MYFEGPQLKAKRCVKSAWHFEGKIQFPILIYYHQSVAALFRLRLLFLPLLTTEIFLMMSVVKQYITTERRSFYSAEPNLNYYIVVLQAVNEECAT